MQLFCCSNTPSPRIKNRVQIRGLMKLCAPPPFSPPSLPLLFPPPSSFFSPPLLTIGLSVVNEIITHCPADREANAAHNVRNQAETFLGPGHFSFLSTSMPTCSGLPTEEETAFESDSITSELSTPLPGTASSSSFISRAVLTLALAAACCFRPLELR